jgi:hypothetical protein
MYSDILVATPGDEIRKTAHLMLADSWSSRVAVRIGDLDASKYYDKNIPDYPPNLVPFRDDPRYQRLNADVRQRVLAGAWVSFNEKTIDVEASITGPACAVLLSGKFPGLDTPASKRLIAQTQVDEQFHILMCLDACLLARKMHGIESLVIPKSLVSAELEKAVASASSPRNGDIVRIAFAAVAEVTVNSYFDLLANAEEIQPFNRETTKLHSKDEAVHRGIYKDLTVKVFNEFTAEDRVVFVRALRNGLDAFVKIDFRAWKEILEFLGVADAQQIIADCQASAGSKRIVRDYSGFRALLAEIGVDESEIDFNFSPS